MNRAHNRAQPTLEPADDFSYGALHRLALIEAFKFPLHF